MAASIMATKTASSRNIIGIEKIQMSTMLYCRIVRLDSEKIGPIKFRRKSLQILITNYLPILDSSSA